MPWALYTIVLDEDTGFALHGSEKLFELHEDGLSVVCETVQWEGVSYPPETLRETAKVARREWDKGIKQLVEELAAMAGMGAKFAFNQDLEKLFGGRKTRPAIAGSPKGEDKNK